MEPSEQGHGQQGALIAGRYRLVERLGAGGMGRVWRARDEQLDCDVAVKEVTLPPELSEAERADRLTRAVREARNAARMRNHPHIVSVHDMVTDQGLPWIVMDLIPSRNLGQVVAEVGPLPAEQVLKVAQGVLEALAASHASGILHRDVKPANVLLTNDGRVLLTDFGIAVQESDMTMTSAGMLVGSPEYVAPERARGEAAGAASDLFSLGATLYYAAEARSPFARETAVGVLTAVLFETPDPVRRLPQLDPLIQGLLAKDQAVRWDAARTRQELARLTAEQSGGAGASWIGSASGLGGAGSGGLGGTMGTGGGSGTGGSAIGGAAGHPNTPPMFPNYQQGPVLTQPMPARRKTGRNVGIGVGAAAVAGAVVLAVVLSGGGDHTAGSTSGGTLSESSSTATSSATTPPTTATTTTTDDTTTTTTETTSPPDGFDPATLDAASTDQTPLTTDALLPKSFTDSKGIVYTATNQWTTGCVDSYESAALKALLNKYHCTDQAIGTYTDADGRILVDLEVMPLTDAASAQNAYQDMKAAKTFTFSDWGIWCPKPGAGSQICEQNQSFSGAQQYGYVLPFHRYILHAAALYTNLSSDPSAQDWLNPAATSGAKAGGPSNYTGG